MEMLVVVAVIGVLVTIAAPGMTATMNSIRLSSASDVFVSGLNLARTEAVSHAVPVVLCKSADATSCSATGGWEQGWIIFRDTNNNGQREETEGIVAREAALPAGLKLTGNQNVARYVSFTPRGSARLVGGGFQAGTLTLCKQSLEGGEARQIVLNVVGRLRVHKTPVASCV